MVQRSTAEADTKTQAQRLIKTMGHFERKRQEARLKIPARLRQLDQEMCKEQSIDFAYLYAVRDGMRIRVCVMRDIDNKCWATAQLGDKRAFRAGGGYSASGAFLMLSVQLGGAIAEMRHLERELLRRDLEAEYVRQQERSAVLTAHHQAKSHTEVSA